MKWEESERSKKDRQKESETDRPHLSQGETIDSRGHFATGNQSPKTSPKEQANRNPPSPCHPPPPPPSSIPLALDPTPSETSATKTPLVHGYRIITLFPPSNALTRILKYMHSHTASAHCVRLVPAVPLSCPEGQAEDNTEERQCVSR